MITHDVKMITIITESILENTLEKDIERLGAHGYTVTNARGKGERGVRDAGWSSDSNIRIEVVGEEKVIYAIAEYLSSTYYKDYAMMLFLNDVKVLRPEKFS